MPLSTYPELPLSVHPELVEGWPAAIPARLAFPGRPYRHSRVSGNPAVACQDCGIIRQYRRDSRLRGNDGYYRR